MKCKLISFFLKYIQHSEGYIGQSVSFMILQWQQSRLISRIVGSMNSSLAIFLLGSHRRGDQQQSNKAPEGHNASALTLAMLNAF